MPAAAQIPFAMLLVFAAAKLLADAILPHNPVHDAFPQKW
jgi:hypothetical protein